MTQPLVSVVMPVRNGAAFLREAIDSVLAQDYPRFELIVIDGGSTDDTAGIAQSYAKAQYVPQESTGLWAGYNEGLDRATGDFIAFLSHDDLWPPHKLSTQVAFLTQNPEYDYAVTRVKFFLQEGCTIPPNFRREHLTGDHVFRVVDNLMVRRGVFDKVGRFNPDLDIGGYIDWFSRAQALPMATIQEVLLFKRIHDANYSLGLKFDGNPVLKVMKQVIERKRQQEQAKGQSPGAAE